MNFDTDWVQLIVSLIVLFVGAGIAKHKIDNLEERVKKLEYDHDALNQNHQKIELTIVNVPTKEDINKLSNEIQSLKVSIVKLEVILDYMARNKGYNITQQPKDGSSHD